MERGRVHCTVWCGAVLPGLSMVSGFPSQIHKANVVVGEVINTRLAFADVEVKASRLALAHHKRLIIDTQARLSKACMGAGALQLGYFSCSVVAVIRCNVLQLRYIFARRPSWRAHMRNFKRCVSMQSQNAASPQCRIAPTQPQADAHIPVLSSNGSQTWISNLDLKLGRAGVCGHCVCSCT